MRRRLRALPVSQRWLRGVVAGGPVSALLAAGLAGEAPPVWLVVALALVSCGFALAPESAAGPVALVVVLVWWGRAPEGLLHPSCLLAAAALIAAHLAALVAAYGPPSTPVDGDVLWLWLRRGSGVLATAPVLWVLARGLRDGEPPAAVWPAGLLAAIVVALAAAATLGRSDAEAG